MNMKFKSFALLIPFFLQTPLSHATNTNLHSNLGISGTIEALKSVLSQLKTMFGDTEQVTIIESNIKQIEESNDNNPDIVPTGPGIPATIIDHYIKTTSCTTLTTQPSDACSNASFCYNVANFVDQNSTSLAGYTFTATKGAADSSNTDSGVFLCSGTNVAAASAGNCTRIGNNNYAGSGAVEFTIPTGATNAYVYAIANNGLLGAANSVALSNIAVCKRVSHSTSMISP